MPLTPRVSIRSFLSSAKSALQNVTQQSPPLTFVVGNEAADLDSICSAIVLAYLRTYASSPSNTNTLYIPLTNIPRADLTLRPELLPVLRRAQLQPSDLITRSEVRFLSEESSRHASEQSRWLLVDHNALLGALGKVYSSRVVGCIDHHDEEGKVPRDCGGEPRVVKRSGSCASLVVEYCREAWDTMSARSKSAETAKWDAELARVALGPVLIDTSNLGNAAKTTDVDVEAVEYLKTWISAGESEDFDADEYYKEIWTAERDVGGFSLADLLRKDFKAWTETGINLGVCSVVTDMISLVGKAPSPNAFLDCVRKFSEERCLSICCVMTRSSKGRELLVWGLDEKGVETCKKFEAKFGENLGLEAWTDGDLNESADGTWRKCWNQSRVENSRKQVAPMLRDSMH
ncbi:uncharacterized protein L3040_004899 [Drepanopeziza brunnea f. sp. 'multigermtubi']|uniref:Putative exopolyphosphatase n=1 Tax=Marssonina brunnea f. sp. multigermtubi (strain MB_m1) TaxID=1072389 RepID=K1WVN5_MARBU|nr:putative exopolyphosphatase [Drepanopeziza brunnea f. sp. 'multigermtubi' MB_m1]EKD21675.1 putative exopolyphosphatase [Drepanopeziza brunnea f. sp. 'multigermtubi' MB_m1]KAJ5042348.1 hypothetical protein L3040_004899 [Drepanopeziza brunnea f. sp. 'multigermtubi']